MPQEKKSRPPHVRKPAWLRTRLLTNGKFLETEHLISTQGLHTICQSGLCPNRAECWRAGTATFMIGGDICTRCCRFCNTKTGRPLPLNPQEPLRVAASIRAMQLRYAVVTSVDRDDLPDYGAAHWAETIRQIRTACPQTGLEVLIPDFRGRTDLIDLLLEEKPDVVGHNMETVRRLTPSVRSAAKYEQSLNVLTHISERGFRCKTGFMVGLGETHEEVLELIDDIRRTGCSVLTIGQYLQPTAHHLPVVEYIEPAVFDEYKTVALSKGFTHVESGPLVRSSYHAERCLASDGD
ncbi:MAG: lipoyl synthase [Alloprevotella sp.]|nr:lipoyl synthase [Alloprevotella sp.]